MFPTTVWTVVRDAGADDPEALDAVAAAYRRPVLDFVRLRVGGPDAEDLCQEVFVRLLRGGVLAKADAAKGSFRSLLRTVAVRTIQDWRRRRREEPRPDLEPRAAEPDFDRAWALHLVDRALATLGRESPRHHAVLRGHLDGEPQDRQKLWVARGRLKALLRREVALTCRSPDDVDEELACLAPYLGARKTR